MQFSGNASNYGDNVDTDGSIPARYLTTGARFPTAPFPAFIQKIIQNGGLIASIQNGDIA